MKWEYMREEEFGPAIEKSGGLCVMCLGCLEKHGTHLPVGTDSLKGDKIVELAADRAGVVMFPTTAWLGDVVSAHSITDPAATNKRGFIGINPHTLLTVLEELCDEIARNGFRKILICNSHGGNTGLLAYFLRAQRYKKKSYVTMTCNAYDMGAHLRPANMLALAKKDPAYFSMLTEEDYATLEKFSDPSTVLGHACFMETMLIYGTYPELVAPERLGEESGLSTHRADYLAKLGVSTACAWPSNYPNSYMGTDPIGCSKTLGEAAVKMSVDRLTQIFEAIRDDEECVNMELGAGPS
ncbi:MAG: creatininase family protein [Clostridia bacterium]|nr:creatininase family protein [Clostridia bacterium]MBR2927475.1 creatininase family protein [Clostridia bacterium]